MKKLKHYFSIAVVMAALAWLPSASRADNEQIEAYVLTAVASNGTSQSVVLTKSNDFVGPRFYYKANLFSILGKVYATSDIDHIRIEQTTISAIRDVNSDAHNKDGRVYNINGQVVMENASSLSNLPKGIYIINGKKYIAK